MLFRSDACGICIYGDGRTFITVQSDRMAAEKKASKSYAKYGPYSGKNIHLILSRVLRKQVPSALD